MRRTIPRRFAKWSPRGFTALIGAGCFFLLAQVCPVEAETRVISGLGFDVPEYSDLGADMVRVSLDGQNSTIVSRQNADEWIARRLLPARPEAQVETFVRNSLRDNASVFTRAGLEVLMLKAAWTNGRDILAETAASASGLEVLKQIFAGFSPVTLDRAGRELAAPHLAEMGIELWLKDDLWFRKNGLIAALRISEQLGPLLESRYYEAVDSGDSASRASLLQMSRFVFASSGATASKLSSFEDMVQEFQELAARGAIDKTIEFMQVCAKDPRCSKTLYPKILSWLHEKAAKELEAGDPQVTLHILAYSDTGRDTPAVHELILSALNSGEMEQLSPGFEPEVDDFLGRMEKRDGRIRESLYGLLEKWARSALQNGQYSDFESVLARIVVLRPDPDAYNDNLRLRYFSALVNVGEDKKAFELLGSVQTGLPLTARIKIIKYRIESAPTSVLFFLALASASIAFYFFLKIQILLNENRKARINRVAEEAGQRQPGGGQRRVLHGREQMNGLKLQEYQRCLAMLGLAGVVTEREIKAAYRRIMKEVHPDMVVQDKGFGMDSSNTKFIELQNAYRRAIVLHRETGQ